MNNNKGNNNEKSCASTSINWYPGHMAKTMKQIEADLRIVDIVIELLDARIPIASQNPEIANKIKNRKKLVVLNKADLADEKTNQKWVNYFENQGIPAVLVDSNSGKGIDKFIKKIEEVMQEMLEGQASKGRIGRKIRAMILGIPNVGKSSFINRISKRTTAEVGNKPGVTKQKQWIRIQNNVELLDTPGILWPKFETEEVALHLAYTGTIKYEVIDETEVAYHLLKLLYENYKKDLLDRYKIEEQELQESKVLLELMNLIGKKRGALLAGGKIDETKTAKILLEDFRTGKIGKITLEHIKI